MLQEHAQSIALWRYQIIAPLLALSGPRGSLKSAITRLAARTYEHPVKGPTRVAFGTVEEWLYRYKRHGFDALRFLPDGGDSWCGYATISGHGTNSPDPATADEPPSETLATQVFPPSSDPYFARDWFYSYALCDFDFDGVYWAFTAAHYEDEVNYSTDASGTYRENE